MPAIAAALVRRQKRMRIWLQARSNTLTLRSNLRFPRTMPTETDTCRKLAVPRLRLTGWDNEPHSTAEQQGSTTLQPLIAGLDELRSRRADAVQGVSSLSTSTEKMAGVRSPRLYFDGGQAKIAAKLVHEPDTSHKQCRVRKIAGIDCGVVVPVVLPQVSRRRTDALMGPKGLYGMFSLQENITCENLLLPTVASVDAQRGQTALGICL
jgi:hypothetical protein